MNLVKTNKDWLVVALDVVSLRKLVHPGDVNPIPYPLAAASPEVAWSYHPAALALPSQELRQG